MHDVLGRRAQSGTSAEEALLASIWQALDRGDVAVARQRHDAAPREVQDTGPFILAHASLLLSEGRIDESCTVIDAFCERWPDDPDGLEWAYRIHQIANRPDRDEKSRTLGRRAVDLAAIRMRGWLKTSTARIVSVVERIATDRGISNAVRARLADVVFNAHQVDGAVKAHIIASLRSVAGTWSADGQVFWASILLSHGRAEEAVQYVQRLLNEDAIGTKSFIALQFAINRVIGSGNMQLFDARYDLLTALHAQWLERIDAEMGEAAHEALDEVGYPSERTGRIAILASPIINNVHAPSLRVLELAASLIRDHGYDVHIFAGGPTCFRPTAPIAMINFYNGLASKLLVRSLAIEGIEIGMTGNLLDDGQVLKPPLTAAQIMQFEPDAVIVYGDGSPVQGLLAGRVPVLLMPTGSGPPVGALDRFACEWSETALRELVE